MSLRVGQIIRITRFGTWRNRGSAWAQVVCVDGLYANQVADVVFIASDPDWFDKIGDDGWGSDEWCLDDGDLWEKVPPSKVPSWVWVQAAKRQLLGSDQ